MARAGINVSERNISFRAPSPDGVYNAIMINAKKGTLNEPRLVTSENDLLKYFTPEETIKTGYDLAYYSALAVLNKTNKLWVTRVANSPLYGGAEVNSVGGAGVPFSQLDQTTAEFGELAFDGAGVDGATTVSITNFYPSTAVESDFIGRSLFLKGNYYDVVTGVDSSGEIELDKAILPSGEYSGVGVVTIAALNYTAFTATGLSDGLASVFTVLPVDAVAPDDKITIFVDGVAYKRTVLSIDTGVVTVDSPLPFAYADDATGYAGTPELVFDVNNVYNGTTNLDIISNLPAGVGAEDLVGKAYSAVLTNVNGPDTAIVADNIISVDGSRLVVATPVIDAVGYDDLYAVAPAVDQTATGFTDPTAQVFSTDHAIMFYPSNEGEWGNDIRIAIITDPSIVKEDNAFDIKIYHKDNLATPLETYTCSRVASAKNGYGINMFVDSMLQQSNYVRAISNVAVLDTILPVEIKDVDELIYFVGGSDGSAVTDTNYVNAAELMKNTQSYDLTVFLDGGRTTPAVQKKIVEVCESRKDCVAVLSIPYSSEMSEDYITSIRNYNDVALNVDSSYASIYTPHVKITDKYNDREITIAPDGFAAAAINESAANYRIWYPAAGNTRGSVLVNDTVVKYSDGDMDYLYDNNINPIRFYPGKGISIWGQKTLSRRPSSLDRLNVRLLLCEIEPAISKLLEGYLFELNTIGIRDLISVQLNNYMSGIKGADGVTDYYTVIDDTNNSADDYDNKILNVDLYIKPIQAIEYINFTTVITNTGVDFTLAQTL